MAFNGAAYLFFQVRIALAEIRDSRIGARRTGEPVPPARVRFRVHGSTDEASYLEVGKTVAQNIQELCNIEGRDFYSFADILDFGCGCGRVIQNFRGESGPCRLYATDIDPDLVGWGKSNLPGIQWGVNGHRPPLPFDDNAFDLIYAVSVFTHLDEDFQDMWLRELQRVARPGATLILTVHGENVIRQLEMLYRSYGDEFRERGFIYITGAKGRLKADGFPDFYQNTFHTKEYIYRKWSAYFDIVNYVERGIGNHQDAVILRKSVNLS